MHNNQHKSSPRNGQLNSKLSKAFSLEKCRPATAQEGNSRSSTLFCLYEFDCTVCVPLFMDLWFTQPHT
jgi:hypothetical protein